MDFGNSLFGARKQCGLPQGDAAEKLGISRQTASKGETVADIRPSKRMAVLYRVALDELKREYRFSGQDAMLVLKDSLYTAWKERKA